MQALTIIIQLFFSGRVARRYGVCALLTVVPLAVVAGFLLLAMFPTFAVLAGVMILRRVGEYALLRRGGRCCSPWSTRKPSTRPRT